MPGAATYCSDSRSMRHLLEAVDGAMATDIPKHDRRQRLMGSVAQIVIGLPLGLIAAGALWQALPFQSGIVIFVTAVVITLVLPALVAARFRTLTPGAVAFAVSATLLNLLVALVVLEF